MTVGDRLAQLLAANGIDKVFGVPGGQTLPLYEGIRKLEGEIEHVLMRDERSAGFAADAYARLTRRVGVCDATVGPGAANLVSPLAEAWCASIPLLAIISDIPLSWEHRRNRGNASQALQQLEIFSTISKWQVRVTTPESLDDIFNTALRMATTGKPGPVVISVPDDIGPAECMLPEITQPDSGALFPRYRTSPDPESVKRAVDIYREAKRPLLVVGGGAHISGAYEEVRRLAETLRAPIVTTISGKGIISEFHERSFGVLGTFGNPVANRMLQESDLVFYIGTKIGQLTTLRFHVPEAEKTIIHLDADPEEIGRNYPQSHAILSDARLGLQQLLLHWGDGAGETEWDLTFFKKELQAWYSEMTKADVSREPPVRPQVIMGIVNRMLSPEDIVVCDASLSSGWASAFLQMGTAGHVYLAPRGLASLGWGAPAAIGAALAAGTAKRILHFAGDGGFGYSVAELEVMSRLKLPIVTTLFNNDILGWIKHIQKNRYQGKYISSDFSHVDFAAVARGFGAKAYTVSGSGEYAAVLSRETTPTGPVVIDIPTDQWETPVLEV